MDIYTDLFNKIISGELKKNTRLKEEELAGHYGISRSPIRQALRLLEQDGLVDIIPKKGARVIGFTVDDIEEIYDIRKSLEILAIRTAIPNLNIEGLIQLRSKIQALKEIDDPFRYEKVDAEFHGYFINASNKPRLISMLNQLLRLIKQFREIGFRDSALRELAHEDHLKLIDALSIRDTNTAVDLLSRHLEKSKIHAVSLIIKKHENHTFFSPVGHAEKIM